MNKVNKISMEQLWSVIKDIRSNDDEAKLIDHILLCPEDFIEMIKNDQLSEKALAFNPQCEDEYLMLDNEVLHRKLCIIGIPIRTSEHVKSGKILKVLNIDS